MNSKELSSAARPESAESDYTTTTLDDFRYIIMRFARLAVASLLQIGLILAVAWMVLAIGASIIIPLGGGYAEGAGPNRFGMHDLEERAQSATEHADEIERTERDNKTDGWRQRVKDARLEEAIAIGQIKEEMKKVSTKKDAWYWSVTAKHPFASLLVSTTAFLLCFALGIVVGWPYRFETAIPGIRAKLCWRCKVVIPDALFCQKCGTFRVARVGSYLIWLASLTITIVFFINDLLVMILGFLLSHRWDRKENTWVHV